MVSSPVTLRVNSVKPENETGCMSTLLLLALLKLTVIVTGCVQVAHSVASDIPIAMRSHEADFEVPPLCQAA
jgi:hypothetical protein